ncbi:MAG: tetratricopeptide repeat protein [Puniceicoccaceae bacterium]
MTKQPSSQPEEADTLSKDPVSKGFISELRRRKVFRVAITYAVVAWLIIQIASATFEGFGIPEWAFRFVVVMLILGFPIALIIAWAVELTPDGVKLTSHVTPTERASSSQKKRNWLAFAFASGLPTVIFGTLAAFFYFTRGAPDLGAAELDKSIAVLPFRNVSEDVNNAYFCDGVQEDILTTLANIGDMQVISRTSVMRYRETDKTIPEIGAELGVSYILEGSVQRAGSRVRVTGQLINAQTDEHLWAKNYDRDLTDIFEIQAEISKEIAQSLQAILTPEEAAEIEKAVNVHPAAYDLVLKGRALAEEAIYSSNQTDYLDRQEVLFRAATEMDPNYVDAWVELAYIHVWKYWIYLDSDPERLQKAKAAIDRAIELAPLSGQVLIGLGNYYYYGFRDYTNARIQYEKALARSPNNAEALAFLGYISRREGKWEDVLKYFGESYRLDPNNVDLVNNYLESLSGVRRYTEAAKVARHLEQLTTDDTYDDLRTLVNDALANDNLQELESYSRNITPEQMAEDKDLFQIKLILSAILGDPQSIISIWEGEHPEGYDPAFWRAKEYYGISLRIMGRPEAATRIFQELLESARESLKENPENQNLQAQLGRILALIGQREESLEVLDTLLEYTADTDSLRHFETLNDKIRSLIHLGDTETALDLLLEIMDKPNAPNPNFLETHLDYWPLRDHPKFKAIVADPAYKRPII